MLLIIFLAGFFHSLSAEGLQTMDTAESEKNNIFYAGINPWAFAAFLPNPLGSIGTVLGMASNQEFGISIYGGMFVADAHSFEIRISTGPANAIIWDTQLQFGYIWYPLEQFMDFNGGLSLGFMLRQFFWYNRITEYTIFNLTPKLLTGWRFKTKSLVFDIRCGWNFASATWSDMPRTKIATTWTPFPFNLTLTTGIAWMF
jgi:hypothetical protein